MSKELLLKLAADYSALAEDLKKLAGEEAPAESEKEEKVDVPFEVEEKKEPPKQPFLSCQTKKSHDQWNLH